MSFVDDLIKKKRNQENSFVESVINGTYQFPDVKENSTSESLTQTRKNYEIAKNNFQTQSSKLSQNVQNQGIIVSEYSQNKLPTYNTIKDNSFYGWTLKHDFNSLNPLKTYSDSNSNYSLTRMPTDYENLKKYKTYQQTAEFKNQNENVLQAKDELGYAKYNYNLAQIKEEDPTFFDKSFGTLLRGLISFTDVGPKVRDGKGGYIELPSYNDLKQQQVQDSFGDDFWGQLGKVLNSATFEIGRIGSTAAMNAIAPGAGSFTYFGSMLRDSVQSAENEGYSGKEALIYGTLSTALEIGTGALLGGTTKRLLGFGPSALNQGIANGLSRIMNNKTLINTLSHAGAEATEEFIQEFLDKALRNAVLDENNDFFSAETLSDAIYSAAVGGITGAFGSIGDNSLNITTRNKRNANQSNINSMLQSNTANIPVMNSEGNLTNPNKYQYIKSENTKIDNLRKSASQYFNNSQETQRFMNTIENIISDKDYNVTFDNTLKSKNGNSVNAQITTNKNGEVEIKINPNSNRTGEFLLVHEITHAIETDSMKKLVLDYASKNSEFNQALESLKQTYGTNDVNSEVLADISGQLFGNQEFINNLSMEQPNIFRRIYNKIVELANKITGNSHEALFIQDLKNKWENAYRNTTNEQAVSNLNGNAIFSIQTDTSGNRYVNVDTDQDIFAGKSLTEQNKIAKKYILDHFRDDGLTYNSEDINVNNKTATKYTNPKEKIARNNKNVKNRISTELDNLLAVSKKISESTDKKNHAFAKDGWEYYETTFNIDGNYFTGILNIGKNGTQKTLYDITNIKKTTQNGKLDNSSVISNKSSFSDNNITDSQENVKSSSTKYSMQEKKNDTSQESEIPLNQRVSGDKLLDTLDFIDEIKSVGAEVDDNGYVTVYHQTTDENAQKIMRTGEMISRELDIFFSTSPNAQQSDGRGTTKLEFKIPAEKLILDDIFDDNADVKISLNGKKKLDVSDYLVARSQFSQNNQTWQEHLEQNYQSTGTRTNMQNIKIPTAQDIQRVENSNVVLPNPNRVQNPLEISQLTPEDASTTPPLPNVRRNRVNDGNSSFASNIQNKTNMLSEDQKSTILSDEEVQYYDKVTNKESLDKAFERLNEGGESETIRWFDKHKRDKDGKMKSNVSSVDIAEGYILMKQYADKGDYDSMVATAKTMRDMGTEAGQAVQAFNIMARMTPEGMVKYTQSELLEAYDKMVKGKTKKWIDQHQKDFDLTPQETGAIMDIMKKVSTMEDGYNKRVELAKIQKIMTDKLPPAKGAGIKSWMRISMLFNPKTQGRNVAGNAVIAPVNVFSDLFASMADKVIGSKTGYRTTGVTNIQNYVKGFKEGLYQSYNDSKQGINTRNIEGNRFEISEGKSFNDNTTIGKSLNKVDSLLSFMLDAGDRAFYEATFVNSINNQLVLNNTTNVTQDMIDIATQEALSRTWQDNNNYTRFVLGVRKELNRIHVPGKEGYGLGDVLIPFAKTPANLTKAIVDYSPAGLVNTLLKGYRLRNAIETGQFTPRMQHDFVQSLGKATAGTMLYVAGYALAKAGIISGESDDDKDVRDFMRNTLGVNSYSIKIGDKSFSYDWAQPIAAPLSMMANLVQKQKENENLAETVTSVLDTGLNVIFEQSFLTSISDVLSEPGEIGTKIGDQLLDLPARAVPTLMKQIVDLTDGTQRQTFEHGKPIQSMINSVKAKIPGLSQTLAPSVDTMGREIQRYGGKNNIFNVFLNPANVSTENISESAGEIYRLYQETSDATIMPRVPDYKYKDKDGNEVALNSSQRAEFLKISGNIIEENVGNLLNNSDYEKLNDSDKSNLIKSIVDFSYNKAREEVLNIPMSKEYNKINEYLDTGGDVADYYAFRNSIDDTDNDTKKESITNYLLNSTLSDKELASLYGSYYSSEEALNTMMTLKIPIKEFIKLDSQEFTTDYDSNGKAITNSKKNKIINYVNSLNLSIPQKAILIKSQYSSYDSYNKQIVSYVNSQNLSKFDKATLLKSIGFDDYNSYIVEEVNSRNISMKEKEEILDDLGFRIVNGRVYW